MVVRNSAKKGTHDQSSTYAEDLENISEVSGKLKPAESKLAGGITEKDKGEIEAIFGEDRNPWHGLGKVVKGFVSLEEAKQVCANYEILELANYTEFEGKRYDTSFSTYVRSDNKTVLDIGKDKKFFQPGEFYDNLKGLVDAFEEAGGGISASFSLEGGGVRCVSLSTGKAYQVSSNWGHGRYWSIIDSVNGKYAHTFSSTSYRPECRNMVAHAAKAETAIRIKHTSNYRQNVETAHKLLEKFFEEEKEEVNTLQKFLEVTTNTTSFRNYLAQVFNVSNDPALTMEEFLEQKTILQLVNAAYTKDPTITNTELKGTLGGAFNAVSYALTHLVGKGRSGDYASMQCLEEGISLADLTSSSVFQTMPSIERQQILARAKSRAVGAFMPYSPYHRLGSRAYEVAVQMVGVKV